MKIIQNPDIFRTQIGDKIIYHFLIKDGKVTVKKLDIEYTLFKGYTDSKLIDVDGDKE